MGSVLWYRVEPRSKEEAAQEGDPNRLSWGSHRGSLWRAWGAKRALGLTLKIDAGGDRLELADSLAKVSHLDPAACRREPAVARDLRQFHLLEFEPAVPGLEAGDARSAKAGDP